jgi:Coenzyme PQQ synthesis protein D (PqqD)
MSRISSETPRLLEDFQNIRPVPGVSFSLLDDRPVLFSESAQKIYELNQTAAYIWCCLLDNDPADAICEKLAEQGLTRVEARKHVHQALSNWRSLRLLETEWSFDERHSFAAKVGKLSVQIQTSSKLLTEVLTPLFNQPSSVSEKIEDTFGVVEIDGQASIFHNGACIARCTLNELVPSLKAHITELVVCKSAPDIVLHAACLVSGDKALLISGRPGAGKTTLAIHLMAAGLGYAADDIVMIAPDGRATGVPFAPALKPGSWTMAEKYYPAVGRYAVHRRPDGKRVRYLETMPAAVKGSVPVGWIIFIKRAPDVPARLVPLGQLETISRLIDASYSPDGKLSDEGFHAIKQTLHIAEAFELQYSDAGQARDVVVELCNG